MNLQIATNLAMGLLWLYFLRVTDDVATRMADVGNCQSQLVTLLDAYRWTSRDGPDLHLDWAVCSINKGAEQVNTYTQGCFFPLLFESLTTWSTPWRADPVQMWLYDTDPALCGHLFKCSLSLPTTGVVKPRKIPKLSFITTFRVWILWWCYVQQ